MSYMLNTHVMYSYILPQVQKNLRNCLCRLEVRVTILFFLSFCLTLTIQASVNSLMALKTPSSSFRRVENCQGSCQPKESLIITPPEESGMFWRHVIEWEAVNSTLDTANTHLRKARLCVSTEHLHFPSSITGYNRGSSLRHQYRPTYCSSLNSQVFATAQMEMK